MVDWDGARALLESTCAVVFDTTACQMLPYAEGLSVNHRPAADPSRPSFDFLGTVHLQPAGDRIARFMPTEPAARTPAVAYDAVLTAYVIDWEWFPKTGDRVGALGKTWRIQAFEKDGSSRPAIYLSEVKHVVG